MLKLKVKQKNMIDPTGHLVYLSDDTGVYLSDNTTGYGTPNLDRNDIVVIPIGYQHNSDGTINALVVNPFDPINDVEWQMKVDKDGWLSFSLGYALLVGPKPIDPDPINGNRVVFSEDNHKYYYLTTDINGDDVWAETSGSQLNDLLILFGQISDSIDQFHIAYSTLVKIQINKEISDLYISSENLSNVKLIGILYEQYNRLRAILESSVYQFQIGNKFIATKQIEFLQTNNYNRI